MTTRTPWFTSRADLLSVQVVGAAVILWQAIGLVASVARIAPNRDAPVDVMVAGAPVDLPLGPDGAPLAATVDTATLTVSDMPVATHVAALGAAVVPPLATIAVTICVLMLCRRMLAGQFFSGTITRLITAVSLLVAGGWVAWFGCSVLASNGVLALVADRSILEEITFQVSWTPVLTSMAIGALAAAFHAGERLQRDAEGLV
ncbi:hypothetical protein [Cellulomonas pakistanensis]|uniref:DUF2975 domain-containing protein n=1 Tax=Cellulomonas pakistanensis TaxID=992287 RepID=A0A919P8J2_9CELL|nr:hypothetical protein [Cellulomonas pakistanensis]GIG34861.1 hypothetical protein Cpa01nite_02420 [Cellulomonas pakistanensis]